MEQNITIKVLGGKEINVKMSSDQKIIDLKRILAEQTNIKTYQQKLVLKGKTLHDYSTVEGAGITNGSKLHLIAIKTKTPQYTADDFWRTLETTLLKSYGQNDALKIMQQFKQDYNNLVNTMSLDDIERIATKSLKL